MTRIASAIAVGIALWYGLMVWTSLVEGQAHYQPGYEKEDLAPILRKMTQAERQVEEPSEKSQAALTAQDYETLFYQTGLGPAAVDQLWEEERQTELLQYQDDFFRKVTVRCERYNAFVSGEYLVGPRKETDIKRNGNEEANTKKSGDSKDEYEKIKGPQLAPLREGDILITLCSHCYGWRNGHAAIVVEEPGPIAKSVQEGVSATEVPKAESLEQTGLKIDLAAAETFAAGSVTTHTKEDSGGWTLESITLGVESKLRHLDRWRSYPSFAVLRLREDVVSECGKPVGAQAAALAREYFCGVPYRLSAGLWGEPWELPEEDKTGKGTTYSSGPVTGTQGSGCVTGTQGARSVDGSQSSGRVAGSQSSGRVAGTQCAHMIWSCYRALGYDLDSDGGRLVTPHDLLESPLLEVVQIYGMNPEDFWRERDVRR